MIIDGRALATDIISDIKSQTVAMKDMPLLTVLTCEPNFETKKFLDLKTKRAAEAGIAVEVIELDCSVTLSDVSEVMRRVSPMSDGIIIQFPFPHLATSDLMPLVPVSHDVDVTRYDGSDNTLLPPVVGAIAEISRTHNVSFANRSVVVVGNGRLVGAPAAAYAAKEGARVTVVTKDSDNISATRDADIIILGAGSPGLLTPDMVKEGVVVFDAGTSEEGGMLVGDADPAVVQKAALLTPVPGGIGPLTIAILLKNVLYLATHRRK
jgi:methylenetetrahydrofolate dehydrogenase (NADP+)/methenyltetrahydrofolate cyclohydrolase